MAKTKRSAQIGAKPGDFADPEGFGTAIERFVEAQAVKGYSASTARNYRSCLNQFAAWCTERAVLRPREVTKPILERYQRHLYYFRTDAGKPLSFYHQSKRLTVLKVFFRWLARQNFLLYNPASEIELPKVGHRLPKHILTAEEVERVLMAPDVRTSIGVRDRAIMETFYSTGIRRAELARLKLYDIDTGRGTVMVREGKGKRDRVIPIGDRALSWIDKYTCDVRPELVAPPDDATLFLTVDGSAFSGQRLTDMVKEHIAAAKIAKPGSCHLFRHTMATLLLENGCDIRFIQAMLGHVKLQTTEIYTQVSIKKLKEMHTAMHPASISRPRATPLTDEPSTDDLLSTLDHEQQEELDHSPD